MFETGAIDEEEERKEKELVKKTKPSEVRKGRLDSLQILLASLQDLCHSQSHLLLFKPQKTKWMSLSLEYQWRKLHL